MTTASRKLLGSRKRTATFRPVTISPEAIALEVGTLSSHTLRNKNKVDLIVMASHGRSGANRWAYGSVADKVLRSTCVPVLLVKAPGRVAGI